MSNTNIYVPSKDNKYLFVVVIISCDNFNGANNRLALFKKNAAM